MTGHQTVIEWMGKQVTTLADLLRPGLRTVCVGFNPTPFSVGRGHYYQGRSGQEFLARLRLVGLLPLDVKGWEDDAAFELGTGFTDLAKRPTSKAAEISESEYSMGRDLLLEKLERFRPNLVIFAFERAAPKFFGAEVGAGFLSDRSIGDAEVFVMPWKDRVGTELVELRRWVGSKLTS